MPSLRQGPITPPALQHQAFPQGAFAIHTIYGPLIRLLPLARALLTKHGAFRKPKDIAMRPSRRAPDELRAVSLERGVVKYAEGSCFVKFGDTHVLVTATLGERQITIDCDVIQADGGTRTASITGAWVALHDAIAWMKTRSMLKSEPLRDHVAAISCGICKDTAVLDLDYAEDSDADTDANFVMTGSGRIVEVQGTAEKAPFSEEQFLSLLALAKKGVAKLVDLQKLAVM